MFGRLFTKSPKKEAEAPARKPAPAVIEAAAAPAFVIAEHLDVENGFPYMRWAEFHEWSKDFTPEERGRAWEAASDAWSERLREALGPGYRIDESSRAAVISSLDARHSKAALEFMEKTQRRIVRTLEGLAQMPEVGKELLVVIDDEEAYYRYIARFDHGDGEFASSAGVQVNDGSIFYVTTKGHLRDIEPVVAHEMTHGCVAHLPLPLWLNEGIAVNTEQRLVGAAPPLYSPEELRRKHLAHWGPAEIQEFWSGASYRRPGDPNMLSYDLGRILVDQLAADWPRFAAFARAAHYRDAGAAAALEHLGISLGALVAALHEKGPAQAFEPQPDSWGAAAGTAGASHLPKQP